MATPPFHPSLRENILSRIKKHGNISFRTFMEMALYDPTHGYYASATQRVGKQGDFITSVSTGRCFGLILAHRLAHYWKSIGKPEYFHIIEPGAHDGALCHDILLETQTSFPDFYQTLCYHLIEATPHLLSAQQKKLLPFPEKYVQHNSLSEISNLHGAVLSNELIDAFPVERIQFNDGKWHQLRVTAQEDTFIFTPEKLPPELSDFCSQLGDAFPNGYTTEYNPSIDSFTRDVAQALHSGLFITIDYGHHAEDYYNPSRTSGTLQTYHQHKKSDNPLESPGEIDITAHVDFTHLTTAAESAGFSFRSLSTQASYLTNHARNWLINLETHPTQDAPSLLRQFQTLTHPSMLGTRFFVLEMEK